MIVLSIDRDAEGKSFFIKEEEDLTAHRHLHPHLLRQVRDQESKLLLNLEKKERQRK